MVGTSPVSRWHTLRELLRIRHGPGAVTLPPSVTRIHMEFAKDNKNGQMGPRKFWQEILPRLKFHNPAIPMIVNRRPGPEGGAIMSVYFQNAAAAAAAAAASSSPPSSSPTQSAEVAANAPSDSPAPASSDPVVRVQPPSSAIDTSKAVAPASDERVVQIDMQHKHSDDILQLFLAETKAIPVQPTPEELAELREAESFARQGEADRRMVRQHVETVRKEKEMLAKAREAAMSS